MNGNRTPFTDLCTLIAVTGGRNGNGYAVQTETATEVFCSLSRGVARAEYYEAYKAGVRAEVTVEVWEEDFNPSAVYLEHGGRRYRIGRSYPTGHGTLELTCGEVVR